MSEEKKERKKRKENSRRANQQEVTDLAFFSHSCSILNSPHSESSGSLTEQPSESFAFKWPVRL